MIRFTKSTLLTMSAVLAGAMAMQASAQQTASQRNEKIRKAIHEANRINVRNNSAKTAAVQHRLVGTAFKYTDGTIIETSDSTHNVYSGTRGAINLAPAIYDLYTPYEQPDFDQGKSYSNDGSSWTLVEQYDQTFDANDKMVSSVYQDAYNGNPMTNSSRMRYVNNSQGILQEAFSDSWNGTAWQEEVRDVFRYTSGGQIDSILNYSYDGSQWEQVSFSVFTYNAGKQVKQEEYDITSGTPEITSREVITYANVFIDSIIGSYVQNGNLVEFYKNKYGYNTAGNVTRQTSVSWDQMNSTWSDPETTDYVWSGDLLDQVRFVDLTNPTEYEYAQLYYESFTTGVDKYELAGVHVNTFPNPARNLVTAEVNLQRAQEVTLSLYNITGAKVWSKNTGMQQNIREQIDLSGLSAGLYHLQVATPSGVVSRKVSVIK